MVARATRSNGEGSHEDSTERSAQIAVSIRHQWKKRPGKPDRFCVCRKFSDASKSRSYFFAFFFEAFFAFFAFFAAFFLATVILLTEPTV
jgi:hypothetical protein